MYNIIFPTQSYCLKPIKRLWGHVKNKIHEHHFLIKQKCGKCLNNCPELTKNIILHLVKSMPNNFRDVIDTEGKAKIWVSFMI